MQIKIELLALLMLVSFSFFGCKSRELPPLSPERPLEKSRYVDYAQVQPIINGRCIACHSCMESPCQLNMQTWEGLRRGAFSLNVYDGARLHAVAPTRMFEDAQSESEWRQKGFADVLNGNDDSIFVKSLRLTQIRRDRPEKESRASEMCPLKTEDVSTSRSKAVELAMPYGLPPLSLGEQELLADWVASGAPGLSSHPLGLKDVPSRVEKNLKEWERFLNGRDLKERVVARYLYEHLFLAHLYDPDAPEMFFKLVRSSTPCDQDVKPISTRRPNDDPGQKEWFYCFYKDPAVVVSKNHIPYKLGQERLRWMKDNFFGSPWTATQFPSFEPKVAGNPFLAFAEIPASARYRFLLEDADYEVKTFIKGPVCNGSFAVNVIQEQFYVLFTNPKMDLMVQDPSFEKREAEKLILPGTFGTDRSAAVIFSSYVKLVRGRKQARQDLVKQTEKAFPKGLDLNFVWDGDGHNTNAILTVLRHNDNAKVLIGPKGDTPKTVFLLDYSTFERIVYNLVINFDVFENVSHQVLTRLYMDLLRMDAEDNFLQLLPAEERVKLKEQWYQGLLTEWKTDLIEEQKFANIPQNFKFNAAEDIKTQMLQKILFERLNAKVRGPDDGINWKTLKAAQPQNFEQSELRKIAAIPASRPATAFSQFFPEISLLFIRDTSGAPSVYSIVHNREHENVSWIINEESRLSPKEDTLTILPGIVGAYPNQYFVVDREQLPAFVQSTLGIHDQGGYRRHLKQYGVDRMNPSIWQMYDEANGFLRRSQPIEAGLLDMSRYSLGL